MQEHTIPENPTGKDKNNPLIPNKMSVAEIIPMPIEAIPKILSFCCIDNF